MRFAHKQLSLKERASIFSSLIREPGWDLLQHSFRPEIRTRINDVDSRESFLYEAIRAQVLQEVFSLPHLIMAQAEREWARHPVSSDELLDEFEP